jgi:Protein of unknown function (DUF1566)
MAIINRAGACAALGAVLLMAGGAQAATPEQKCQEKKLKARGKLQLCLQKNSAKVIGGKPDASATCQSKFQTALTKAGTACRYLDNGDGTLTDLNTGLQWEKKDNLDGTANPSDPHDADNIYTWCIGTPNCTNTSYPEDGSAFTDFLSNLNSGAAAAGEVILPITGCFAGHCDWRLPTIVELQGIADAAQGNCGGGSGPCIDPVFGYTQANIYWSSTTDSIDPSRGLDVDFMFGIAAGASANNKAETGYVRAVRGGS